MLRNVFPLCLMLALCGCGDTSNKAPATGNSAVPQGSSSATAGNASHVKPGTFHAKPEMVEEKDPPEVAEDKPKSKPEGLANSAPSKQPASDAEKPEGGEKENEEKGMTTQEAFGAAQKLLENQDFQGAIEVLEEALPGNSDDINLLFAFAQLNQNLAGANREKPDYARHQKAAEYVRLALTVDSKLATNPGVRNLASKIYYNEACALAIDKQPEKAFKILREAVDFGFKNFGQLEKDSDLESVRTLSEYPEFLAKAREAYREHLRTEVEDMFAKTKPFDFDFELTDIEGNAIAKADFTGKVLIVDVWGTWCPPCRMEIPHFVALQKAFQEVGMAIVGLNSERVADEAEALKLVRDFHKDNGMNYRCAVVTSATIEQIPNMQAFPTTLFLDRSGKVRARVVGYHEFDVLEMMVQKLLDEKAESADG